MTWKTGPVAGQQRAVQQGNNLVAIAETTAQAAFIVRSLNQHGRELDRTRREVAGVVAAMRSQSGFNITELADRLEEIINGTE